MKVVFVLFDSLVRQALGCYGGVEAKTPNFDRLAARGIVFDNHFVGSLPCMPARRDIHTGRINFLHRGWGPMEPFDHSFAAMLRDSGIPTHLITDHYHYFEDGGFGYHGRYSSWEFVRGQEKDHWRAPIDPPVEALKARFDDEQHDFDATDIHSKLPYYMNRLYMEETGHFPMSECLDLAEDFLTRHARAENWFLHLECFDPHEPFFAPDRFLREDGLVDGRIFDWIPYRKNDLDDPHLAALRANYFALVEACDEHLGRLLDRFDRLNLWEDTCLIVTTDHGLMLGEKEYLGKNRPPFYNEVAHIPLIVAAPGSGAPRRSNALTQTTDLMPTFLDLFGLKPPTEVTGRSLAPLFKAGAEDWQREGILFGQFGSAINFTDGRWVYFLYPREPFEADLYQYTLMPTHSRTPFEVADFDGAEFSRGFDFTRGYPTMRLPFQKDAPNSMLRRMPLLDPKTRLFDLEADPEQKHPIDDPKREADIRECVRRLLDRAEAPAELYGRYRF